MGFWGARPGSSTQPSRRNLKRTTGHHTRSARSVQQGEEVEGVHQFWVVKQNRHAAAVVAGGSASSSSRGRGEGVEEDAREDADRPSQVGRIRASRGRFAKFNSKLSPLHKSELCSRLFGGILNLAETLPTDLTKYLVLCYKPESSEMVFPRTGRIRVDADSVHRVFDLPNRGQKVIYVVDKDATRRFGETFNITGNSHPSISTSCKMIQDMAGKTDGTFFIVWLAVAFNTFLAPTTSLKLRPKCYGLVLDHEMLKNTNICLFVAEHINEAFRNMDHDKQTRHRVDTTVWWSFASSSICGIQVTTNLQSAEVVHDLCKSVTEHMGNFIGVVVKIDEEEPDIDPYVWKSSLQTSRSNMLHKERDGLHLDKKNKTRTLGHQPICGPSSYTFHGDGSGDAPTFDLAKLQQGMYNVPHINKIFEYKNRLEKQDMVMLPVLECSDPNHPEEGRHYWVFNVNLRDE
ncbi:hypothetical protein ZWY2020_048126 [Hordeum vulgare]|nr:hypothetical protein ZWY2020_048126 [Hordeum vulgare]